MSISLAPTVCRVVLCTCFQIHDYKVESYYFLLEYSFLYLAVPGLSCSIQGLQLWHRGLDAPQHGGGVSQFPDQGSNQVLCIASKSLNHQTTREAPEATVSNDRNQQRGSTGVTWLMHRGGGFQALPNVPQQVHGRPQQEARFPGSESHALPNVAKSDFFLCGATMLLADSARQELWGCHSVICFILLCKGLEDEMPDISTSHVQK